MTRKPLFLSLLAMLALGVLTACTMLSPKASMVPTHPQALEAGRPMCTECHADETMKDGKKAYAAFDHTVTFVKEHKYAANRDSATCAACHGQSFCADCHTGKTMMAPNVKLANRPDREMPHRANYLTLHRMDAKVDPTGCFKCHGKANNATCQACHR